MQLDQTRGAIKLRQTGSLNNNPADIYRNERDEDYSTLQQPATSKGFTGKKLTTIRVNGNKAVVVASPPGTVPKKKGVVKLAPVVTDSYDSHQS